MSKCLMTTCDHDTLPGDDLCAEHAAYYRRRECDVDLCRWCGVLLTTVYALARGYCIDCREMTPAERVEVLATRRKRIADRERRKRMQVERNRRTRVMA
ncbi:MAG TPA: hypothetical protein VMZ50_11040 [Phycisphaerae bacterium]|nr:hypothetical protein [Phycisphaerae bacterium]